MRPVKERGEGLSPWLSVLRGHILAGFITRSATVIVKLHHNRTTMLFDLAVLRQPSCTTRASFNHLFVHHLSTFIIFLLHKSARHRDRKGRETVTSNLLVSDFGRECWWFAETTVCHVNLGVFSLWIRFCGHKPLRLDAELWHLCSSQRGDDIRYIGVQCQSVNDAFQIDLCHRDCFWILCINMDVGNETLKELQYYFF